jgi:hypothetical protein
MKIKDVVQQIIALKRRYNIREQDATPEKEREWYTWALANGHCNFVERNNVVLGFLEWVRLNYIPRDENDIRLDHSIMKTGPVGFVGNCIATERKVLNMLKKEAWDKNKDCIILCWHNKKRNLIFQRRVLNGN